MGANDGARDDLEPDHDDEDDEDRELEAREADLRAFEEAAVADEAAVASLSDS